MDAMYKTIELSNQKELLRIFEEDFKKAKTDKEKKLMEDNIEKAKAEINKIQAA